jgi:hypothetical protein
MGRSFRHHYQPLVVCGVLLVYWLNLWGAHQLLGEVQQQGPGDAPASQKKELGPSSSDGPLPSYGVAGANQSGAGRYYPPLRCPSRERGGQPIEGKSATATAAAVGEAAFQEMVYWTTSAREQERIQSRRRRIDGDTSAGGGGNEAPPPRKYLTFEPETAGASCAVSLGHEI